MDRSGTRLIVVLGLCLGACGAPAADGGTRSGPSTPTAAAGSGAVDTPMTPAANGGPTQVVPSDSPVIPPPSDAPAGATCRAGHYIGKFVGAYRSAAWLDGSETIMFATADANGRPGFEFWLEQVEQPCMPGQEFCAGAIVKGGKLRGNVTPFEDASDPSTAGGLGFSVRFEIDLTGELDCNSGEFRGRLENGCYDILSALYRFDGTITGDYGLGTSAFTAGLWEVAEKLMPGAAPPTNMLGGNGDWSADFADDSAAPTGPGEGLCSGETGLDTEL
jgi:hypothetical protein